MHELISLLVGQLGVDEGQAKGGAGLLFNLAQEKLGDMDFQKIKDAVPDVGDLISAAPEGGGACWADWHPASAAATLAILLNSRAASSRSTWTRT